MAGHELEPEKVQVVEEVVEQPPGGTTSFRLPRFAEDVAAGTSEQLNLIQSLQWRGRPHLPIIPGSHTQHPNFGSAMTHFSTSAYEIPLVVLPATQNRP